MPKVYNKRRPHEIPEGAVYVGRPSRWGNHPYKETSKNKTREQAIREFQIYAELKDFYEEDWLRTAQGEGSCVLVFTLAVPRRYTPADGERGYRNQTRTTRGNRRMKQCRFVSVQCLQNCMNS